METKRLDTRDLRRALGNFATGVAVVTYADGNSFRGITVNSFVSVSMEPPLILVSLKRESRAAEKMVHQRFAVNVLRREQAPLAQQFAGRPDADLTPTWTSDNGVPVLDDCAANFVCDVWKVHGAGDHLLVLGQIDHYAAQTSDPLIFHCGDFTALEPLAAR